MSQGFRAAGMRGIAIACAAAVLLASCSNMGGAFADRRSELARVPNIEFYSSDQALAQAKQHFRAHNYGYSAALYKRAAELNPKDAEAFIGLAASYDRLRRFDLADRVYAQVLRLTGGTVQYYNNLGYSYLLRGDLTDARANFLRAYERDPHNVVVANNLALMGQSANVVVR
jgi:Flp pilus assembly protein TadD